MNKASKLYTSLGGHKGEFRQGGHIKDENGKTFMIRSIHIFPATGAVLLDEDMVIRVTFPWHSIYMFNVIHEEEPLIATSEGSVVGLDGSKLVSQNNAEEIFLTQTRPELGRKKRTTYRNDRKDLIQDPTPGELEDGYEEASKLVSLHEDPKTRGDRSPHMLLPGVNQLSGDLIQGVVAMRIQGYKDVDIAKHLGTSQPNISRLESRHREAFVKAEVNALENVERKYKVNLWGVRAALSEAGPEMVKVLIDLAKNEETKSNIRKDSAIAVLNMIGAGYSRQSYGGKDSEVTAGAKNYVQNVINTSPEHGKVVEAETVEFQEAEE